MFLKVKGMEEASRDWWIFECRSVHYWKSSYDEKKRGGGLIADHLILIRVVECNPRPVVVINIERMDETIHIVAFDTIAYLCNDKGETIEKIEP